MLNIAWNLLGATILFMAFLRFCDLFLLAPAIQGVEAYASMKFLRDEFWSCLRTFPKNKEEEKKFVKDKKFYHLIPYFIFHALVSDIIVAWFSTFTNEELMNTYHQRPVFFFFFFCMVLIAMPAGFTANGYLLQILYVLIFEKGSYCEAQWRTLMKHPICATSLGQIWSDRWHQALKSTWLQLPFNETRILTERLLTKRRVKSAKRLAIMAGALSVFMMSGLLHEYLAYVNIGYHQYKQYMGEEMCFFTIHGVAVMIEKFVAKACKGQKWATSSPVILILRRVWTLGFACYTIPLFLRAFMYWDSWHSAPFFPLQPYILNIMRQIPGMHHICGSLF
ncbi:uncharacterized protein BX663DRAFT_121494 [Cokeromyces recurvatus]|uniref:uncharacterized protein n=1 Tax=Cokeromyces recurvatus TaxID=90255 RepID=UPI00221F3CC9|nr:uncharacterized protein BX663DRAFT_121494 [Cokeromyces recurvatus]KAI7906908.1 hypothetical protein BX663DRAFT_121494 [Cokeromyces recurvatus]